MELKELPIEFDGKGEVSGNKFRQLKKTEFGYIYERTSNESVVCYEVFKRRINNQFNTVSYPKSKSFGMWAYCCSSLDAAERKLQSFEK